jgi:abhydrolase domain-containing protein 6
VATLGLFNAAGVLPPGESEFERLLARGDNPLIVDSRADFERLMALVFEDEPLMPWPVARVLTRRFIERAAFNEKIWQDIWARRTEVTGLLPDVEPPVLIVWGERDHILDVSSIDVFARWLPRSEVHVLMDTGHSPMLERPWRSAGLYRSFLARHADGNPVRR